MTPEFDNCSEILRVFENSDDDTFEVETNFVLDFAEREYKVALVGAIAHAVISAEEGAARPGRLLPF